jgi:hypothetical protein
MMAFKKYLEPSSLRWREPNTSRPLAFSGRWDDGVLPEREIDRLKTSLETYRLSSHPERAEIVRWHVRTLDERQDALEELQSLIIAEQQGNALH